MLFFFRNLTLDFFKILPKHIHLLPLENDSFKFLSKIRFFMHEWFLSPKNAFFIFLKTLHQISLKFYQNICTCSFKMTVFDFWKLLDCSAWVILAAKNVFLCIFFRNLTHWISLKLYQNIYPCSFLEMNGFDCCKKVLIVLLQWFYYQKLSFF